jgi:hypothetical protein
MRGEARRRLMQRWRERRVTFDSRRSSPIGSECNQGRGTRRVGGGTTASRPGATRKGLYKRKYT